MKARSTFPLTLTCAIVVVGLLMGAGSGVAEAVTGPGRSGPNVSVDVSITVPLPRLSLEETLFIGAMAAFFDMDVNLIASFYYPASFFSIAMASPARRIAVSEPRTLLSAMYLSRCCGADPLIVIGMKKKGHGWAQIARQRGRGHRAEVDQDDHDFERHSFVAFAASYYGVQPAHVGKWLAMGMSEPEITFCLNLAARARVDPSVVISERRKGASWTAISAKHKVPKGDLAKPVKPAKRFHETRP